jgi:membrane protein DedA with SNARE-associated domain
MNRENRDYALLSVVLLVAAIAMYLYQEEGWMVALTIAISAVGTFGSYWVGRLYKRKRRKKE